MLVFAAVFAVAVLTASFAEHSWSRRVATTGSWEEPFPRGWSFGSFVVVAVLAGVAALRWRVGTDYTTYHRLFPSYVEEAKQGFDIFEEPGLRVIAWISNEINGDSAMMFAVAAIITIGLSVRTIWRWSPAFAFSIAAFILSGAWHGTFNGVRQFLACAILFAGHRYIIDRRFGKWLLVVFAAMLFHISAMVALFLYLVPTKRTSFVIQGAVFALGLVVMLSSDSVLEFLAIQTGDSELSTGEYANLSVNPLRVAFAFVPIALYWLLRNREAIEQANLWFYVNMLAIYGATFLASASSALLARFAIFALPFVAIGLAAVTSVPDAREKMLSRGAVLVIFAVFLYIEISGIPNLRNFQWIVQRP